MTETHRSEPVQQAQQVGLGMLAEDDAARLRQSAGFAARGLGLRATVLVLCPLGGWLALQSVSERAPLLIATGVVSLMALLLAVYCGARVLFDVHVFRAWSRAVDPEAAMLAFDRRIGRASASPRSLAERVDGARRWQRRLQMAVLLQIGTALVATGGGAG